MSVYFFDLKSAGIFSRDEDGMELPDVEAAHEMAFGALMDAARIAVIEGSTNQRYAVEVRNGYTLLNWQLLQRANIIAVQPVRNRKLGDQCGS